MLGLDRIMGGEAGKMLAFAKQLKSRKQKPVEEMSELQFRMWNLVRDFLTEMEVEEPMRSFILRMTESFSDEQIAAYARGLVLAARRVEDVLEECGVE